MWKTNWKWEKRSQKGRHDKINIANPLFQHWSTDLATKVLTPALDGCPFWAGMPMQICAQCIHIWTYNYNDNNDNNNYYYLLSYIYYIYYIYKYTPQSRQWTCSDYFLMVGTVEARGKTNPSRYIVFPGLQSSAWKIESLCNTISCMLQDWLVFMVFLTCLDLESAVQIYYTIKT